MPALEQQEKTLIRHPNRAVPEFKSRFVGCGRQRKRLKAVLSVKRQKHERSCCRSLTSSLRHHASASSTTLKPWIGSSEFKTISLI